MAKTSPQPWLNTFSQLNLKTLMLKHNALGPDSLSRLSQSAPLRRLRQLGLSHNPGLAAAGLGALCCSSALLLSGVLLRDHDALQLAQAPNFVTLRRLSLADTELDNAGMQQLGRGRFFPLLRHLKLHRYYPRWGTSPTGYDSAGVSALAQAADMPQLAALTLMPQPLDDAAALALLHAPGLPRLVYLPVNDERLRPDVRQRLNLRLARSCRHV